MDVPFGAMVGSALYHLGDDIAALPTTLYYMVAVWF